MTGKAVVNKETGSIILPKGRFMFLAAADRFVGKKDKEAGRKGGWMATVIFEPGTDLSALKEECKRIATEKFGDRLGSKFKLPWAKCSDVETADGDPRYDAKYDDWEQIRSSTFRARPGVLLEGKKIHEVGEMESIEDMLARVRDEAYTGRWGQVSVTPATFDTDGNRGVKLWLNNIKLLDHDERLGGGQAPDASDDFGEPTAASGGKAETADDLFA